jgi:MFS family permease
VPSQETHRQPGFATGFSLLIPITLSTMAIVLLAPILPRLLAEYSHVPNFEYWVPMVITVPALCVALFSPVAGMLGDYYGRRRLLILSFVGYGITGIAPVFLTDLNMILLSRIGVGIMEALIMVLTTTMLGDYFKGEKRDRWLAAQTATASVSALVFFNLGGQLGAFGWRTPFWIYLSALGMMVLVILFTWEPKGGDPTAEADHAPHNGSWKSFPWARFLPVLLVTIYSSVFFYTVQIQAGVGLSELGLSNPAEIGFLTSIASLGVPLGTFLYSRIGGRRPVLLLAVELFTLSIGFMVMALANSSTLFLVGCFINQLGAGMLLPTLLVWAISQLAFEVRGRGAGLWQSAFAMGQFICPLVVTFFAKSLSGLFPAFAALSVAAILGAVVASLFLMRSRTLALS